MDDSPAPPPPTGRSRAARAAIVCGGAAWLALVTRGFVSLFAHASTPGAPPAPPPQWPANAPCVLDREHPTLLMFAHPGCPCTLASLGELERVMAKCKGRVAATVLFYSDPARGVDAPASASWALAARIPGVRTQEDPLGAAAGVFAVHTSGSVALYAADGRLCFHGGITGSRGHQGDNTGASVVVAILDDPTPAATATPIETAVFGCDLTDPAASPPR